MKKELGKRAGKKLEIKLETVLKLQHGGAQAAEAEGGGGAVASPTQCTGCRCPSEDHTSF